MKKFQYNVVSQGDLQPFQEKLTELGTLGWELTTQIPNPSNPIHTQFIFKREVPE